MSTVRVRRLHSRDEIPEPLLQEIIDLENQIRDAAQRLFESRGGIGGDPDDDWARAERQICWSPQAELKESETAFRLLMGVPGLRAADLDITLLPEEVIVSGMGIGNQDESARVHFSEFGSGVLFRKIALPACGHVASAVVIFENHLLKVAAAKVESNESPEDALVASNSGHSG